MNDSQRQIRDNVARFLEQFHAECTRLSRNPDDITIVAVSKTFGAEVVSAAVDAGLHIFGENRVQEAKTKIPQVQAKESLQWHLIGHLQTNKAKDAVALFDFIHSVDQFELAETIDHRAELAGKTQDILLQVNTTAEQQKSGCDPDELDALAHRIVKLLHIRIQGLMTIGPFVDDPEPIRRAFRLLRESFDRLARTDLGQGGMRYCSMGMTDDWPIALAEGANLLRIGRAIFGERD